MRVLVISVHPDDEALGCAGTILKHRERGDELYWLILTAAYTPRWSQDVIDQKAKEVARAAELYGMREVHNLRLPTTRLDTLGLGELIGPIHEQVSRLRPEIVYTVHEGDVHSDHRTAFQAITSAIKPFNMKKLGVRRILSFETLSSTDAAPQTGGRPFLPNVFVDVSPFLERKLECMQVFDTEQQGPWQPRGESAIRALARYRGATIDVPHAEAFMLIRECEW